MADEHPVTAEATLLDVLRDRAPSALAGLARPAVELDAGLLCADLERVFGRHPDLTSVVLRTPGDPRLGLVARGTFELLMGGRFGFGRNLHHRRPVGEVAVWDVDVLAPDSDVTSAAAAALSRPVERRFDDLLVRGEDGGLRVLLALDVLEALAADYAHRATHDQLTGLANRSLLFARLGAALQQASAASGDAAAVAFIDLDGFKPINDRYGHDVGDGVLVRVAEALRGGVRPGDVVARVGGDEFAVLTVLRGAGDQAASLAGTTARRLSASVRAAFAAEEVTARASVGVAVWRAGRDAPDGDALVRLADAAMYSAKRRGDGQVEVVEPSVGEVADVAAGLRDSQLRVHYQPIVALPGGGVVGLEALVRWQHPVNGLLAPGAFLEVAEREGVMTQLDEWVLDRVCRDLAEDDGVDPASRTRVDVNVSRQTLRRGGLHRTVVAALERHGVAPDRLGLEISESATAEEVDTAAPELQQLRAVGVKVVLDDAGAGQTSLRHLTSLGLDGFKLDRELVQGLLTSEATAALVQVLVDLGRSMGLSITAEGVETEEQARVLAELRVPQAQGWLFARPAPRSAAGRPAEADVPAAADVPRQRGGSEVPGRS